MATLLLATLLLVCVLVSDTHALVTQLTAPSRRSDGAVMMAKAKAKAKKPKAKSAGGGFGASKGFGGAAPKPVAIPSLELNTGAAIPSLAFGTYKCPPGDELASALETAIAAGYRHFDTARAYQNEATIGAAIANSGVPREDFFITTKLWASDHGTDNTNLAIDQSLEALQTDYIDLLLLHGPDNGGSSAEEKIELRQQSWVAMEARPEARAIGVSNFEQRHIESVLSCGSVMPAVNQIECHAQLAQIELRSYCAINGILIAAYGAVGAKGLRADPAVQAIAKAHKRTPAQVSLRYSLQRGGVALTKSVTPKRIAENAQLFDFELSTDEVSAMEALDSGTRSYWDNSGVP